VAVKAVVFDYTLRVGSLERLPEAPGV